MLFTQASQGAGYGKLVSLIVELVAELDGGGTASEGGAGYVNDVTAVGELRVNDYVEAGYSAGRQ